MGRLLLLFLSMALASCKLPSMVPAAPPTAPAVQTVSSLKVEGRIGSPRTTQATIQDIAHHATVSLIDTLTGHTLSTTVTDEHGKFFIEFGAGFVPIEGRPYFLEASKGIKGENPSYNQAGADAVRLRTLLFYHPESKGWLSLDSDQPGPVYLSEASTAISVAIAHLQEVIAPFSAADFIGCLATGTYVAGDRPLSKAAYDGLLSEVEKAVLENRDPLHYIVFDSKEGVFLSAFIGFAVSRITPSAGGIGTIVTLEGSGLLSGTIDHVSLNGLNAPIVPGSLTSDRLQFRIPSGARSGPVSLSINGVQQSGPRFTVTMSDGHRSIKGDKLYVANPSWGTVAEVKLNGEIRTLRTGLASPRQVILGKDNRLYVSCHDSNSVVRFDLNGGAFETFASGLSGPHGLAFDDAGILYVSNRSAGTVVRLTTAGAVNKTYTGFNAPEAIAFNPQGHLFVAEAGGAIRQLLKGSNTPEAGSYAIVPTPKGLAVDSAGDLYVASNAGSLIYRIGSNRLLSVFTMINRPGGLSFDESGNLFVSDTDRNLINRISPSGDALIVAYGISHPRGLAVDASGKAYVSLNQANAILEIDGSILRPFVTGIPNPFTLTYRAGGAMGDGLYIGQPEINTISFASTAVSSKGELRTVATGVDEASGADRTLNGTVYMGRWGREDSWQPDRNPHKQGGYQALTAAGALQAVRYPYVRATKYRTITASEEVFELSESHRTLAKITPHANGTRTVQLIHSFGSAPGDIVHDAGGRVYVTVPGENKVYRFAPPNYTATSISDFNQPFGLSIHPVSSKLYVFNRGDGKLSVVDTPATATKKTADLAAVPAAVAARTAIRGIACSPKAGENAIYLAAEKTIVRYDISANSYAIYVTLIQPDNSVDQVVSQIAAFSDGVLYARGTNDTLWTVSASKMISQSLLMFSGGAKEWRENKVMFETDAYDYAIYQIAAPGRTRQGKDSPLYLGALGRTHEVAVDTSMAGQEYLYVASPIAAYQGGLFRFELFGASPKELYIPIKAPYSLAVAADRTVYVGAEDKKIYQVDLNGTVTQKWTLGALPYGLDRHGSTLWAVGADSLIYSFPTTQAGNPTPKTFGIMEPVF